MKIVVNHRYLFFWLLISILLNSSCAPLIAKYDKVAYQQATSLKVDALALMDKATESYSVYESSVEEFKIKIEKAFEYAKGRPKNKIITEQWSIMKNPDRNLLGGFLVRWKSKDKLSQSFVDEAKKNVSLGFDQIIGLESGLIKPTDSE